MTIPAVTTIMFGQKADGSPSDHNIPVRLLVAPTRTLGLFGDDLEVAVKAADWPPADVDLSTRGVFTLVMGTSDAAEGHSLGGYLLRSVDPLTDGKASAAAPAGITEYRLRFSTFPALYREGRGGRITEGVLNVVDADGRPDDEDPSYRTNSQLATLALDAIGETYGPLPAAAMNTFDPPGPLDWGNAHAPTELEAVLARIGFRAHPDNTFGRAIRVVQLPEPGDAVTIPQDALDVAEPFELATAPPLTGTRIVVTSGDTRAVIVESRTLESFEWVWFDEAAGVWKNDDETLDGIKPGDIDAFRAGPGETVEARQQFARLFSALRLKGSGADKLKRLVPIPQTVDDIEGFEFSGKGVAVKARFCRDQGKGQFRNEPGDEDDPVAVTGVVADADNGVIVLPRDAVFVRMPAGVGAHMDAEKLVLNDLIVLFAHEADTANKVTNYSVRGWQVDGGGVLQEVTDTALLEQWTDPDAIVISAPFLREVLIPNVAGTGFVTLNGADLETIMLELAQLRVGAALATSGIVPLRGLFNVQPGDWDGAVSRVTWDVNAFRTQVSVNEHVVPDSVMQQLEAAAQRSFISGLNRFSLPGAHAAKRDVRNGPTVLGGAGAIDQESRGADRGMERAKGQAPIIATPNAHRPLPSLRTILAKLTGSTMIGMNKWSYAWEQVTLADDGSATTVTGGFTSAAHGEARNLAEAFNTGTGIEANGVDRANLPEGWTLKPPGAQVVEISGPWGDPDGSPFWTFHAINSDDGECPEEPPAAQFTVDDFIESVLLAGWVA